MKLKIYAVAILCFSIVVGTIIYKNDTVIAQKSAVNDERNHPDKRRWKVERLFAWLHKFRRIVVRCDYHAENFLGFVHLACIKILLRCYV